MQTINTDLKINMNCFPIKCLFSKILFQEGKWQLRMKLCTQGPLPFDSSEYVLTASLPFQRNIQISSFLLQTAVGHWAPKDPIM